MIKIRLLGVPEVTLENKRLDELHGSPILLRLFCFLLTARQRSHLRSDLAAMLWPDVAQPQATQRLSNIFWRLRTALGSAEHILSIDKNCVRIDLPNGVWLDVDDFAHLTADCRIGSAAPDPAQCVQLELAYALYRGEYLHGIDEEWLSMERLHWQERYLQILEPLVVHYRQRGDLATALTINKQLLALDPYHESGHHQQIELLLALHQRDPAIAHFQHYVTTWRSELQLAPSPQMRNLALRHQLERFAEDAYVERSMWQSSLPVGTLAVSTAKPTTLAYLRREIEIRCKSDELYDLMADRLQQKENLVRLQELVTQFKQPAAVIDLLARQAWFATRQGHYNEALTAAQAGLHLCENNDRDQRALMHRLLGVASEEMGNFHAAQHHYRTALKLDESGQSATFIAADLSNIAAVHITTGDYHVALSHLKRAEKLLSRVPTSTIQTKIAGNSGFACLKLGQIDKAADYFQKASLLAKTSGEQDAAWWIAGGLIRLHILQKEYKQALQLAHQQLHLVQSSGDACALSVITELLALLYLAMAEPHRALDWAQQTLQQADQKQQWRYQLCGWMRLAQAQQMLGNVDAAFLSATQALALYTSKAQTLAEEPELLLIFDRCAKVANHRLIV